MPLHITEEDNEIVLDMIGLLPGVQAGKTSDIPNYTPTFIQNNDGSDLEWIFGDIPNDWKNAASFGGGNPNNEKDNLIIGNSVASIGSEAFRDWNSNNQPLVIPDSVTSIGGYAFQGWNSNDQPLVIPDSVTSIEGNAFGDWTSNNHPLVIPDSVTSIGNGAFREWTSNNQPLVIGNSVTSIGNSAFHDWSSMTEPIYFACLFSALTGSNILFNNGVTQIYARVSQGWPIGTTQNISGSPNAIEILEWENYPNPIPNIP